MPYTVDWVIHKRVLYSRVWGQHTQDDMRQSDQDLKMFLADGIPLIHLIMDAREMESMPTSLGTIQSTISTIKDPAYGWVVAIGTTNPVTKFMGLMIAKLFRLRFRRVETLKDGLQFLSQMDQTLDWNTADTSVFPDSDVHDIKPT